MEKVTVLTIGRAVSIAKREERPVVARLIGEEGEFKVYPNGRFLWRERPGDYPWTDPREAFADGEEVLRHTINASNKGN